MCRWYAFVIVIFSLQFAWGDDPEDADGHARLLRLIASRRSDEISDQQAKDFIADLRRTYSFKSIKDRLDVLLPRNQQRLSASLSEEAIAELDSYEMVGRLSRTSGTHVRPESLRLLHEESVREFISRDGNGYIRTPPPSAIYLKLTSYGRIPFDPLTTEDRDLPIGIQVELPPDHPRNLSLKEYVRKVGPNDKMLPSLEFMKLLHQQAHDSLLSPRQYGYIKSTDAVSGFVPHHVQSRPTIEPWESRYRALRLHQSDEEREAIWEPIATRPPDDAIWLLESLQLVSLLKQTEPLVYDQWHLPSMEDLDDVLMRKLDEFEHDSLEQLYSGQQISIQSHQNQIRMVGALRASKNCLQCHDAQRGDLLGALTYTIRRSSHHATKLAALTK